MTRRGGLQSTTDIEQLASPASDMIRESIGIKATDMELTVTVGALAEVNMDKRRTYSLSSVLYRAHRPH